MGYLKGGERREEELRKVQKFWKKHQKEREEQEQENKLRQTTFEEILKRRDEVNLTDFDLDSLLWTSYRDWIDKINKIDIEKLPDFKNQMLTAIDRAKKEKEEEGKQQQKWDQEFTARRELTNLVLKKTDFEPWISLQNDLNSALWQGFHNVFHKINKMNFKEFASFKEQLLTAIQEAKKSKKKQEPTTPIQQKDNKESNQKLFEENNKEQIKEFFLKSIEDSLQKNNLKSTDLDSDNQNYQEQINNCRENKLSEIEERIKKDIYNKVQKLNQNSKKKNPDQKDKQEPEKTKLEIIDKFTELNDKKQLEKIIAELKKEIKQLKIIINPNNPTQKQLVADKENQLKQLENKLNQLSVSNYDNNTKNKKNTYSWLPFGIIGIIVVICLLGIMIIKKRKKYYNVRN